jgi:RNA polymerase sigma-70 factor, ECF subfamily
MRNRPDQAILELTKRFEPTVLEEIFDRYSQGIYRYAYRLLGDTELAKECMSETFSRYLEAIQHKSSPPDYLQAYLYRIAHNWITDLYRKKLPTTLPLDVELQGDDSHEPQQVVAGQLASEQLRAALALLTPDQRQVIALRYLEEWDTEAIARALGKPVGAIRALQHRGLNSLRRILQRYEDMSV